MTREDIQIGARLIWRHEPRAGYGWAIPDLVTKPAGLVSVEALQQRRYAEFRSPYKAIKAHTQHLKGLAEGAARVRSRVDELQALIGEDPGLRAEVADVVPLVDLAVSQAQALCAACEVEVQRLLRDEELRTLRFKTALTVLRPLLDVNAAQVVEVVEVAPYDDPFHEVPADDTDAAAILSANSANLAPSLA